MARAFIGVGSNIAPQENLPRALALLAQAVKVRAISTFYTTPPAGRPEQPDYYNGVVEIKTALGPRELKYQVLRRIEEQLGRQRSADKYAPRTIDLDLLLYDNLIENQDDLSLPDPQIAERAFLAIPLAELAGELELADTGRTLGEVAAQFRYNEMRPLVEFSTSLQRMIQHESGES